MKSRLRLSGQIALLIAVALASSCRKPYHQETERYIFVAANINLPYWQEARAGFMDAAHTMGVKAEFTGPTSYAPDEELAAFRQAMAERPSGILVAPTRADVLQPAIDEAIQAGIPVICADSDAPGSRRILFIGTDNYQAGLESGKQMAELLHGKGRIVLITIPGQLNLDERVRGVKDALGKYPDIKIVQTLDDRGDPRSANDQISAMLSKDEKFDGILCVEASGGPGAGEVLHRLSLEGKIVIVAMDKTPETLQFISEGTIQATITQKPYTMAFYGLRFLDDLHHNVVHQFKDWRTAPVSPLPARVDTGTAVINSKNLAEFQAADVTHRQPL
jgi:ribose transport system substrate-binding protein